MHAPRCHRPALCFFPRAAALAVLVLALAGSACRFGEARFESTALNRAFDPAGTVFSYLDAHDDDLVLEDNPRAVVVMTWIIFDPNGDLNDLEGSALADYSHELKLRDALAIAFDRQGELTQGAAFKSIVVNGEELGDGAMTARVHLAPERLNAESSFDEFVPFASERTTDVTITNVVFEGDDPVLEGDVTITFARTEDDPGDARVGSFLGTFTAPFVEERTAEQNLALLDVADVLGVPLAPREPEEAP